MPYFKWKGVNLVGDWHHGRLFARTEQELDARLMQRDIALIRCWPTRMWFAPRIKSHACAQLFSDLATLCDAGILLPNALEVAGMQLNNPRLQSVVLSIADEIKHGVAPHNAFAQHPHLFDSFNVNMVRVGHRSGTMPQALLLLAQHLNATYEFSQKIKTTLIGPLCTLVVLVFVAGIMFTHIVPSFASLFVSAGHDIPGITRAILAISDWMLSWHAIGVALVLAIIGILMWRWFATGRGRYWRDRCLTRLPFIGSVVQFRSLSSFFRALSLLLHGGSQIVSSISIARDAIENVYIKEQIGSCGIDIQSGKSVTQALRSCSLGVEVLDLLHMVHVGERSGRLAAMLERVALLCEQRAADRLKIVQMLVQPVLMVSLGLLVSLLIFAIYVPIFNLSDVVSV